MVVVQLDFTVPIPYRFGERGHHTRGVLLAGIEPRMLNGATEMIAVPIGEGTISSTPRPGPGGVVTRFEVIGEEEDHVRRIPARRFHPQRFREGPPRVVGQKN